MTATVVFPEGNYNTAAFSLTDTSETTVLTVPTGFSGGWSIVEIWAADQDGTANTLVVKVTKDSTARILAYQKAIPATDYLQMNFTGLILNEADTIKLTGGSASIDGYVSYIQLGRRTG